MIGDGIGFKMVDFWVPKQPGFFWKMNPWDPCDWLTPMEYPLAIRMGTRVNHGIFGAPVEEYHPDTPLVFVVPRPTSFFLETTVEDEHASNIEATFRVSS